MSLRSLAARLSLRPLLLLLPLLMLAGCGGGGLDSQALQKNNRAVGLMGQYRNEEARQLFAELVEAHPDHAALRVNLAIATLNRQQEGDEQRALTLAREVLQDESELLPARYVAGLAALYLGQVDSAMVELDAVAAADPKDAHAAYFAAQAASQLGRDEHALALYQRALQLDPYLRSAYYGAALLLRKSGDADAARAMLADYQRLQGNPRAHLAEFRYTRMGPKAEAQVISAAPQPARTKPPKGPVFGLMQPLDQVDLQSRGLSLSTVDLDGDGLQDLFLAGGPGQGNRLWRGTEIGFERLEQHPLSVIENVTAAVWGDIDNDAELDVFLCRQGANVLSIAAAERVEDRAAASKLDDAGHCRDAALFDADHDGDLDLYVLNEDRGNELFSNNLDGSFRRLSEVAGSPIGNNRGTRQLLIADIDADRDADLLLLKNAAPHALFINDRLWAYRPAAKSAFAQVDWQAMTVADPQATGRAQLVGVNADGGLFVLDPQRDTAPRVIGHSALPVAQNYQLLAQDFDGDGVVDLLLWSDQGFELFGFDTQGQLRLLQQQAAPLRALVAVLRDYSRGPELIAVIEDRGTQLVRWAPGDGRQGFIALAPSGRSDGVEGVRSNASGIGTGLSLRVANQWSLVDSFDRSSAPGQSLQPSAIGLGSAEHVDFVEIQWSDGVYQTELGLAAGRLHRLQEEQRQLASCPVLFAWNGERFAFVSDLLGVGGIGFLLSPGQYAESRPWEFFKLPEGALRPRDGRYQLKIAEPMEEVAYLDAVRLHVHDLPPGWSLTVDERMHTGGGPAPTGAALFYREADALSAAQVLDGKGVSQASALAAADGKAVDTGPRDLRFLGRLQNDMQLSLLFDRAIKSGDGRPLLIADGWVEYPYSQTLFAAWQASAEYRSFSLDARVGGVWQPLHEAFGYPAGMPREFALPLDALPAQADGLRLRGNLEVYWDRLQVVRSSPPPAEARHAVLAPMQARVARIGFPRRSSLAQRRPHYDYDQRAAFWDTRYPGGHYTAFGSALELLEARDDAFAIVGPGDEAHIEFEAPAEPPPGWRRLLVLEVRGYAKDMDLFTRDGGSVGPLPVTPGVRHSARRDEMHARLNTRFQDGR